VNTTGSREQANDRDHKLSLARQADLLGISRKMLTWRLSTTLKTAPCIDALKEAMSSHGKPEIMNTDQGSQFTSIDVIKTLKAARNPDQQGWQRRVARQRLRGTAVANDQIRGDL